MKLLVTVTCAECGQEVRVHILGGWDIKGVEHECGTRQLAAKTPGFRVTFDPPRSIY